MFKLTTQSSPGMMRLKHFGLDIEMHAIAPIIYHQKIQNLRLKFDSRLDALHVFAELSGTTVELCQQASVTNKGISFELFWTFQPTKSWDMKRSSPALEMFKVCFNGTFICHSNCIPYFDQMAIMVTEQLHDAQPRKRRSDSEELFVQTTVCITCDWDNTYKHRGVMAHFVFVLVALDYFVRGQRVLYRDL